ncbi:zinc finger CCCH domain-containing protein, partial [archaeon]
TPTHAHSREPPMNTASTPNSGDAPCRFFRQGQCKFGSRCCFADEQEDTSRREVNKREREAGRRVIDGLEGSIMRDMDRRERHMGMREIGRRDHTHTIHAGYIHHEPFIHATHYAFDDYHSRPSNRQDPDPYQSVKYVARDDSYIGQKRKLTDAQQQGSLQYAAKKLHDQKRASTPAPYQQAPSTTSLAPSKLAMTFIPAGASPPPSASTVLPTVMNNKAEGQKASCSLSVSAGGSLGASSSSNNNNNIESIRPTTQTNSNKVNPAQTAPSTSDKKEDIHATSCSSSSSSGSASVSAAGSLEKVLGELKEMRAMWVSSMCLGM